MRGSLVMLAELVERPVGDVVDAVAGLVVPVKSNALAIPVEVKVRECVCSKNFKSSRGSNPRNGNQAV